MSDVVEDAKAVVVRIDRDLRDALKIHAVASGVSMQDLLATVVYDYLDKNGSELVRATLARSMEERA